MSRSPDAAPAYRYTAKLAGELELAWQARWQAEGTWRAPNPAGPLRDGWERVADRPKRFVMDMFPYPSGKGLHVGHPLGFIGTDVWGRYLRMKGHNVVHTIGYDAFGLPAEQFAIQTGQHPRVTTDQNIATMRRQLLRLGLAHDDRRAISTADPTFYRWTQWIFLQIFGSWYDADAGRARPITELVAALGSGVRPTPDGRPWADLTEAERRTVVDGQRLAYRAEVPVNWCPALGTVLANEEVIDGRSERGNFPVYRRPLTQWMLRITAYADRLIDDLGLIDWPEPVKVMQRNWIGRSTGAHVRFALAHGGPTADGAVIEVFTTRPDTLFGATYVVLAPEHALVDAVLPAAWPAGTDPRWTGGAATPADAIGAYRRSTSTKSDMDRQSDAKQKTGVFTGVFATNPVNGAAVPVFVADYVLMGYGTGAIMAVPAQDERDWDFAEVFGLPVVRTVEPPQGWDGGAFTGEGPAIASASDTLSLDGLGVADAKAATIGWLEAQGTGSGTTTYRLRDWLFSRQRYWGEPFPIVFDELGPRAVPESMLPVELPDMEDFAPKVVDDDPMSEPEPPLGRAAHWRTVELDVGEGPRTYERELNTMPNWAGSCWYYLRYLDPTNEDRFVDADVERYWMGSGGTAGGVDLYVGGVEHAVLHLLYSRFWHKVLFDLGHVSTPEPFQRLFNQGMIQAPAFTDVRGFYVEASEVVEEAGAFTHDGEPVTLEFGKMGKSLRNAITPDEIFEAYGADTLRLYEMAMGPLDAERPWSTADIVGVFRLLQRVWRAVVDEDTGEVVVDDGDADLDVRRSVAKAISGIDADMAALRFNTSVAKVTELVNHVTKAGVCHRSTAEALVKLLSPLAPHVAAELWSKLGHDDEVGWSTFPVADPALLVEDTVTLIVQVNGKVKDRIEVPAGADAATVEAAARASEKAAPALAAGTERKVIVRPPSLVNFVVA